MFLKNLNTFDSFHLFGTDGELTNKNNAHSATVKNSYKE